MRQLLNKLFNTLGRPIIGPETGKPFLAIQIPQASLPPVDPESVEFLTKAQRK